MLREALRHLRDIYAVKLHTAAALTGESTVRLVEIVARRDFVASFRLSSARLYTQTVASHYCELTHCGVSTAAYAADSVFSACYTQDSGGTPLSRTEARFRAPLRMETKLSGKSSIKRLSGP